MMLKTSGGNKRTPATLRSLSGAGFEFEDLISAWLQVQMLTGEKAPGIGGAGIQLQAQVSSLSWHIDDLLLTAQINARATGQLAISAKGNLQVNAAGLPEDFVSRAWAQWRDPHTPMSRSADGLALVTRGIHSVFDPTWCEVKNACAGSDIALAMSRIRSNPKQSKIFDSVQKPDEKATAASDEETIELIRRLHVFPVDLQLAHSDTENQAIARCRLLLASGAATEAEKLWHALINVASEVRLRGGTITLRDLWSKLRKEFDLHHHPDFARDWETLSNNTSDYKARIETELPSGHSIQQTDEKLKLKAAISTNVITAVFGESGTGKSALVKNVLDTQFGTWEQIWFGADELKTALSAARRSALPLRHELGMVLNASVSRNNILVLDSVERIDPVEFVVIRNCLQAVLTPTGQVDDSTWRIVIIMQAQTWAGGVQAVLGGRPAAPIELGPLKISDVKSALRASPSLGWLTGHDETVSTLTNLRTLAWVIQAGAALGPNASRLSSHTAVADCLWNYWTRGLADVQALMMSLAKREASFERSFALTDMNPSDVTIFTHRPDELPLHLNFRTNRIEFDHDLASDWARFQFLKQIWTDTPQWASFAENPLWTNSLRMLGQHLLRQAAERRTAWDVVFEVAERAKLNLAGDILLDALCLDLEAERFLTERVDLLLANDAKHFTRLLVRFHHIGTVPTGGMLPADPSLGLYLEAQYRSVVIGRWFPVLRFLIAQREKLRGQVSSAVAKVIQTWLTGTPRELGNGTLMPFRRELAEIALAMARTVQTEKGTGVMYLTRGEPLLYTAPLAAAADLPDEVGYWALELAGRRKVAVDVTARITEILRQQADQHRERLRSDPRYKAKHEAKRNIPHSLGSIREQLPPWPLGARWNVDMDFRKACFTANGIQPLMRARPEVAAEVLLALIIEEHPEREYGSHRHEVALGLEFAQDSYPTAFWKSPFFLFFQIAPDTALKALIALVNFCTERWLAEIMDGSEERAPGITLQMPNGDEKTFVGWWQVFDWSQESSNFNGNLFCALDALERWITLQLDACVNITSHVEQILREGTSAALIGLLVNVGKYRPSLFSGVLAPLLTDPHVFHWDTGRVNNINFDTLNWVRAGETIFNIARDWTLAPHRQRTLRDIVVDLLTADAVVAARLQALIPNWSLPEGPKESLECKLLFARLDRDNYRSVIAPETGAEVLAFACPDDLSLEVKSWQDEHEKPLQYLLLPERCEKLLQAQQTIEDDEAVYLFNLLKECEADATGDESTKIKCGLALASTLVVLADNWLANTPGTKEVVLSILRAAISEMASTAKSIRSSRIVRFRNEMKFAAYAAMHLWMKNDEQACEWEASVLELLTSGDSEAAATIIDIAYAYRHRLGSAWWRLLQAGVFWSGLLVLSPRHGDGGDTERAWSLWLAKLRRFPLRGKDATANDLKLSRVAAGCERLDYYRRMRAFTSGEKLWQGEPEKWAGIGLDGHFLALLFHWLINGKGSGDWTEDAKLVSRLWAYDAKRAKERAKDDNGEYDLPSQNLGYDLLLKLAELSLAAPEAEARALWEPVLVHGPEAHYALQHFIRGFFLRLQNGDDAGAFERVWRTIVEYGLAANWVKGRLWYYGERLLCDLLGFGNEEALLRLAPGAVLRMRDVYERWAEHHLDRDEECISRFCSFLTKDIGAPLRLDGLRWVAATLKAGGSSSGWHRDGTEEALIELVNVSLNQNAQDLAKDSQARQALVETAAALAARNIPAAFSLQERIKLLR